MIGMKINSPTPGLKSNPPRPSGKVTSPITVQPALQPEYLSTIGDRKAIIPEKIENGKLELSIYPTYSNELGSINFSLKSSTKRILSIDFRNW